MRHGVVFDYLTLRLFYGKALSLSTLVNLSWIFLLGVISDFLYCKVSTLHMNWIRDKYRLHSAWLVPYRWEPKLLWPRCPGPSQHNVKRLRMQMQDASLLDSVLTEEYRKAVNTSKQCIYIQVQCKYAKWKSNIIAEKFLFAQSPMLINALYWHNMFPRSTISPQHLHMPIVPSFPAALPWQKHQQSRQNSAPSAPEAEQGTSPDLLLWPLLQHFDPPPSWWSNGVCRSPGFAEKWVKLG